MALALFVGFAVITQLQFNRISNDKIQSARMETYNSAVKVYEGQQKAHDDCVATISVRETYRGIFAGIEDMIKTIADYPVSQFPDSEFAQQYQADLTEDIKHYITDPVRDGLPPKTEADCPKAPTDPPVKP